MTITKIEVLTYAEVKKLPNETMKIKGHEVFFINLGDTFGYSVLVFKNGKHIHYANDYELHWRWFVEEHGREALKQKYIDKLNNKLFTDEELLEEIKTYDEYNVKSYFLRNYWIMRYDHHSIFAISEEDRKAVDKARKKMPYLNPISFCYVADSNIIDEQKKYHMHLEKSFARLKENNETFREMVSYELANHEACITGRYTETLDGLGMKFEELTEEKQKIVLEELKKQEDRYYM